MSANNTGTSQPCFGLKLDTLIACLPPSSFREALVDEIGEYGQASRKAAVLEIIASVESTESQYEEFPMEQIKKMLSYDPETGKFHWLNSMGNKLAGKEAGCTHGQGYVVIKIMKRCYRAHVLAWMWVHGYWPVAVMDHINGVRNDNRIANLREATVRENNQNKTRALSNSTSGLLGAHVGKKDGSWISCIHIDRKKTYLGTFSTPEAAHEAYVLAKRKLHAFNTL